MTAEKVLICGAGIGGLASAIACRRAGWQVDVLEQAEQFSHVGAGIQLGPNVTRILHAWGLGQALAEVAAFPDRLQVRDALTGQDLAYLPLGDLAIQRYGAPYATVHRADIHQLLLDAVRRRPEIRLHLGHTMTDHAQDTGGVTVRSATGSELEGDLLIGADGLWSALRQHLLGDGKPRATGHLAYRALVAQTDLPMALRSQQVTVWLGPKLHMVHYPVQRGEFLNVVVIVQAPAAKAWDVTAWDHAAHAVDLQTSLRQACAPIQDLVAATAQWRLWVLHGRPPMRSAAEHAVGRVALLGDAAHPMFPYLAQGAGMAIEDADVLGHCLQKTDLAVAARASAYAQARWRRNARVQSRSERNGRVFHATKFVAMARNLTLRAMGERVLDVPWLYRGPVQTVLPNPRH